MSLHYPYSNPPKDLSLIDINPQIKWVRQWLPMRLNHINCYLIKDGSGWCIVDTGMRTNAGKALWQQICEILDGPVTKVIVTHHHPDHIGLAGFICDSHQVPLFATEAEYFYARTFSTHQRDTLYWEVENYLQMTCMSEDTRTALFTGNSNGYGKLLSPIPTSYHRLTDNAHITIGDHEWQCITTRGHSPEHLCLYSPALDILISGDQVLPEITSNVSVTPTEPDASPLHDWLLAHDKIKNLVPDSVLVLPSHQLPFRGLHHRLTEVAEHHEERMDRIREICSTPRHAQEITTLLFDKTLEPFQNFLAVGEVVAHLNCLMERNTIIREVHQGQTQRYYTYKSIT